MSWSCKLLYLYYRYFYSVLFTYIYIYPSINILMLTLTLLCVYFSLVLGRGRYERGATSQENAQRWEEQFSALSKYKKEHGDCNVPARAKGELKSLGMWVRSQRKAYSKFQAVGDPEASGKNNLTSRFEKLRRIGFKFIVGSGMRKRNVTSQGVI